MSKNIVLEVKNLRKKFGNYLAIEDISFKVDEGEILGFLGPNGAGKSTTIYSILGLIDPDFGSIKIFGKDIKKHRSEILKQVNYATAEFSLPWNLSLYECLLVYGKIYEVGNLRKRIDEVLEIFEMSHLKNKIMRDLSFGQRARGNLCKALLNKPKLLLLDEPMASMDPDVVDKGINLIRKIQKEEGISILYTSHNMWEIEEVASNVVFINHGKIIAQGSPLELTQKVLKDADEPNLRDVFIHLSRQKRRKMNLNRVFAIVLRHYFLSFRQLERLFEVLISPVLMIVLWGFLTKYVQGLDNPTLAGFLLGGILLWIIFEKVSTDIGISFMYEVWDRNLVPLMSSPITFVEFLTGLVLVSLAKILFTFTVMAAMGSVFYSFEITSLGFGLSLFALNLFLFASSFGIFSVALVLKFGNSVGPLTWIIPFLIQPFAAVFYPISILPPFFQKIAQAIPLSYVFEGMRQALRTDQFNFSLFWGGFILNIIYLTLSVMFFGFILRKALKSGRLVKVI